MKTQKRTAIAGILAAFAIALVFTGCDDGNGNSKDNKLEMFTVTFNSTGGIGTVPNSITVESGSSIILPYGNNLLMDGYTFGGWRDTTAGHWGHYYGGNGSRDWYDYTDYNSGDRFSPTANITLYAIWNLVEQYTITFDANGSSGTTPNAQTVTAGSGITLPDSNDLLMSGYIFAGWYYYDYNMGYLDYDPYSGQSFTNYYYEVNSGVYFIPTDNITLYARWDAGYTVTFNANGGNGTVLNPINVDVGSYINLPYGNSLYMDGYTFDGWVDSNGYHYNSGDTFWPTTNITLYAKWNVVSQYTGTEDNPIPLTTDNWIDGSITSSTSDSAVWYSFNVTSGTTYDIFWNDADNSGGTLDVRVAAYYSDWNNIFDVDNAGLNIQSFTASSSGTVKIKVYSLSIGSTGTFAVAYNTSSGGTTGITLDVKQIIDDAPLFTGITISRSDANKTYTVTVSNPSDYTSIAWEVAGVGAYTDQIITGNGATFTLDAEDVRYNAIGTHFLILTVTKDSQQYQRAIPFAIVQ